VLQLHDIVAAQSSRRISATEQSRSGRQPIGNPAPVDCVVLDGSTHRQKYSATTRSLHLRKNVSKGEQGITDRRWGLIVSVADQAIVSASNFVALIVITRSVQPADVGRYALIFASVMIMSSLQPALISTPHAVLSIGRNMRQFLGNQYVALAALSSLQVVIAIPVLSYVLHFDVSIVVPAVFFLVLLQGHELTRTAFFSELRPQMTLLLDACTHIPRIAVLAGAAFFGKITLPSALWTIVASLTVWLLFARLTTLQPRALADHIGRSWRFGRWLVLESVAYVLSTQAYLYVVNALLDLESVAGLAASQNLLGVLNVVFMGAVAFILPLSRTTLLEQGFDNWRHLLGRTTALVTIALIGIVAVIALFAKPLLGLLYGAHYAQYSLLLLGLALPLTLQGANALAGAAFITAERPEIGFVAKLIAGIFAVVWAYPGIVAFGIWGAVIGLGATPVIWVLTYALFLRRGALSEYNVMRRVAASPPQLS
jgi:O-antigen/teichoic acid export membrane protein